MRMPEAQRNHSWVLTAVLLVISGGVLHLAYFFTFDFDGFLRASLGFPIAILIFSGVLYLIYKMLGVRETFKTHIGALSTIVIPIAACIGIAGKFLFFPPESMQGIQAGVIVLALFFIICTLGTWKYSRVYGISKLRAAFGFAMVFIVVVAVYLFISASIVSAVFSSLP